ncbi:hypothetical protein BGW41_002975 [Actinomortierella wolfii]|nr:hypothetical protein BGW41_002975 [Actinomortierella wolfii]
MQATFERFESYDFDADANFQAGLKSILAKQQEKTADEQKEAIDNAKFFYFSRFVEAFDLNEYKAWKSSRQAPSGQDSTVAPTSAPSQSTATPSSAEPTYPKSFQEICELIASGKPIPGIRQIPNNLAEGTPSEAKMAPRRKPWEKAVNEKSQDEQANQATGSSSDATVA